MRAAGAKILVIKYQRVAPGGVWNSVKIDDEKCWNDDQMGGGVDGQNLDDVINLWSPI